jgi:V8-like Glu-specific endopeptidase
LSWKNTDGLTKVTEEQQNQMSFNLVVFIEAKDEFDNIPKGSGILISPDLVLTAANCIFSRSFFGAYRAKKILIYPKHQGNKTSMKLRVSTA